MTWQLRVAALMSAAALVGLVSTARVGAAPAPAVPSPDPARSAGPSQRPTPAAPPGEHSAYLPLALFGEPARPLPFDLEIIPEWNHNSIPRQRCVFLVTLREGTADSGDEGRVHLSAEGAGAAIRVEPGAIAGGDVAEVTVIPDLSSQEQTLSITVRGQRGDVTSTRTIRLDVMPDRPDQDQQDQATAAEIRDRFTPWLAEHHPELGITPDTSWSGTIVTPYWLIVSHYLFFSPEWEMHVAWHIMIPPHDWRRIDLRHRWDETRPSYAFEISSWAANDEPKPIDPPEAIWR